MKPFDSDLNLQSVTNLFSFHVTRLVSEDKPGFMMAEVVSSLYICQYDQI